MIVACAKRGQAGALISRDHRQLNLAREVGLTGYRPSEILLMAQGDLFNQAPPKAKAPEHVAREPGLRPTGAQRIVSTDESST